MKNKEKWRQSKFVFNKKGKLKASRDPKQVGLSSRLVADIVAEFYSKNLRKFAHGQLLDLGCGKVPLYSAYKDLVFDNTCVDWQNSSHGNMYLDYSCDLNEKLPLNSNAYDTIILSDVLEHISEPQALWHEMNRVLKINGILFLNVPFYYWVHEEPHDYYRYTEYALRQMAEKSGFEIVQLKSTGGVIEILADVLSKSVMHVNFIGRFFANFIQYVAKFFIRTSIGKKISQKTSKRFPLGYTLIAKKI